MKRAHALLGLSLAVLVIALASAGVGAMSFSPWQIVGWLGSGQSLTPIEQFVLLEIRLPRLIAGLLVGAGLAVAGAAMQALFRNPLADPGLLGVSSGAALGAAGAIVWNWQVLGSMTVPTAAFLGGLGATALIWQLAHRASTVSLLLAGVAINATLGAVLGLLTFLAQDPQLRALSLWHLGSLGAVAWDRLPFGGVIVLALGGILALSKQLDVLLLGEEAAYHLEVEVSRLNIYLSVLVALGVGTAVALAGHIGFVGLVAPHLVRLVWGPVHGFLLPASALVGAGLLLLADSLARTWAAPAEIPVGILTSALGGPFFLWLLKREKGR